MYTPNESCLCIIKYDNKYYEPCLYNKKDNRFYCLSNGGSGFIGDYYDGDDPKISLLTQSMSFSEIAEGLKAITDKRYAQYSDTHEYVYTKQYSNQVSSKLPPKVDSFLHDMAQWSGLIDYSDIIKFGERATPVDIKLLKSYMRKFDPASSEDEMRELGEKIKELIK